MAKNVKVKPENLQAAFVKVVGDYKIQVTEQANVSISDIARETAARLKQAPTPAREGKGGGKYRRAWDYKIERSSITGLNTAIVYVKAPHYRLAHLLEHGHDVKYAPGAKRRNPNGKTHVEGIEHIAIAEQAAIDELYEKLQRALQLI